MRRVVWPRMGRVQRILSLGGFQGLRRIFSLGYEGRGFEPGLGRKPFIVPLAPLRSSRRIFSAPGRIVPGVSAMAFSIALAGCGAYRPVVTPVKPDRACFPTAELCDGYHHHRDQHNARCSVPGLANVFDGSGDALLAQASLGNGPISASLDPTGSIAVTANSDGTLTSYNPSTKLRTNTVQSSTLSTTQSVYPFNMIVTTTNLFVTLPLAATPGAAVMSNSSGVYQYAQQLNLAASPVTFAGNANAQRIYAISQDNGSNSVKFGACDNPSAVTTPGQVASIEISTVTISRTLPVGICPVYGISSTDNNRTYILNRGSGPSPS